VKESFKRTRGQALKLAYEQGFGLTVLKILPLTKTKKNKMGNITAHQVLSPKGERKWHENQNFQFYCWHLYSSPVQMGCFPAALS
jgi:hypothetical protein